MKKRILSFLLALLMVVSIFPAPAYATDSADVTITPTEIPCPTCCTVGCTSEHLNWCTECKKDDCGKDHNTTEPTDPATEPVALIDEGDGEETHPMVGKYVKLTASTTFGYVTDPNWSYVIVGSYPAFMEISDVLEKDGVTYYRLKAAPGYTWPTSGGYSDDTVYLEAAKLVEVVWCADCQKYDCGTDHTATEPSIPENSCGCCDDCTGEETCECLCGKCDFCEKAEDPDVPSISATVNGQTVTVSGTALPEGAELVVAPISRHDGGFLWDIKLYDSQGVEWQPIENDTSVKVTISLPNATEGEYVEIIHVLDHELAIISAMDKDVADIGSAEYIPAEYVEKYQTAMNVYKAVSGEENAFAAEIFEDVKILNGQVSFVVNSFSIYEWNGSSYSHTRYESGSGDRILMQDKYGEIWYVTRGQTVYMDSNVILGTADHWTFTGPYNSLGWLTNDRPYITVNTNADIGSTITAKFDYEGWGYKRHWYMYFVVVEERTVYFNGNSGTAGASSLTAITDGGSRNQNVTLPNATRTGYTFNGWYTAASGGTKVDNAGAAYMPGSNGVTLYAQWTPITYTIKFDPNTANANNGTVTGSMSNISMTYDVATTLPRNKYINSGDGMVFLGWATSPAGGVVYKDGAQVSNLTTTNGATVTLYAKWKYGLNSTVYIGINNTYHNPNGTYTAGGVTIPSYHRYPNEPAQMTGDFDRVVDTTGSWTYDKESARPLAQKANAYIKGNIFNSPDYEMTYVQGENTLGIADPTGAAVRAMLNFTEADYNAMIAAWLEGMRSTLIGYGDTSVDWKNAKANDFVMVPYVIKFQNYDSWYIDMAVVPKALYTLAYDGNVENGYTAAFSGVAFPPSQQYTEGSSVAVVTTPIGYNGNNLKIIKVVDGHTYTAVFQYWYDANGNTYGGTTGRNNITLTEDTILYAKWDYPDASYGNLNITKNVVDKDAYEDPSATQTFTFIFTTSDAGSYSYTIYDRAANVKTTGTIANNGTFTLQDGWRIRITDLPKGATYTATETAVNYYTASGTVSGTISAGATTYATVTNTYQKNAGYTVKHYLQNNDKTGYIEQAADQQNLYGTIGQNTSAQAKTYSGYTVNTFSQAAIKADGSTEISIYYDLVSAATVTWKNWDGTILETDENVAYGTEPSYDGENPEKAATAQYTYTFDGWDPTPSAVTGDATYTAKFKETVNQYTLSGEIDHGTVTGPVTVDYGTSASITFTPSSGYAFVACKIDNDEPDEIHENVPTYTVTNDELKGNTHAVVNTKLINYTIKYELVGGNLGEGVTNPATYTIETETFTLNNPTRAGYKFKGWATSENATTGTESITIAKGTTGNKTYYAVWERSLVDLTIEATTADTNQNLIFTVSGTRSDGVAFAPIDVVLCSENNFQVTIKDMPVGEYTVTEKDGWSWREDSVDSKTADLRTTSQTVPFDFGFVDDLHWLSGYSYKCKKGGS